MGNPLNMQAILDWCEENDPMMKAVVEAQRNENGFILLSAVGFETGRQYQAGMPGLPPSTKDDEWKVAVIEWCKDRRKDLVETMQELMKTDGVLKILQMGFEAGRRFQDKNPRFPLNESHLYMDEFADQRPA